MDMKYENLQHLGSEEKNPGIKKALPLQRILGNLYYGPYLILISLGLSFLLLVVVCVIGHQGYNLQKDLVTLNTNFSNFTSDHAADIQRLTSNYGTLQETINSLKAEVEDHREELQAGRSLKDKVNSLEGTLQKKEQEFKADQSQMLTQVQKLVKELRALSCQLAELKNNGSKTCCPLNWMEHEGSCYWFSQLKKSWLEANKSCQMENAHLVIVNSLEEQRFIEGNTRQRNTWIGLTDKSGPWKWVDGSDLDRGFTNWSPEQPDDWYGHGLGGGEDCAHFTFDGHWNDNACLRPYLWVCEIELS
ncbi:C-type lectin domain family 10 member A isoform X2 [Fukomys damarensis]|uniref:Macrophage asialoglycoprotein-binding protein 1 n=1 Tax=Fukomys damarensis TaxID=885580 RepID=A0A091CNT8_FUKDA|nr:C-type lectin domain family 10 member A isoform X2 [Fukomys damarensis]KFO18805.1 Macrophage asialoglycoprotein-binding protein 1 [Fukomys damarensis]